MDSHAATSGPHEKQVGIIVNGQEHQVADRDVTFAEIVALAFPIPPSGNDISFSITYRRGHGDKEGILAEGQSVQVKDRMVFNVTSATRS